LRQSWRRDLRLSSAKPRRSRGQAGPQIDSDSIPSTGKPIRPVLRVRPDDAPEIDAGFPAERMYAVPAVFVGNEWQARPPTKRL
jgi:hypothetical protein